MKITVNRSEKEILSFNQLEIGDVIIRAGNCKEENYHIYIGGEQTLSLDKYRVLSWFHCPMDHKIWRKVDTELIINDKE